MGLRVFVFLNNPSCGGDGAGLGPVALIGRPPACEVRVLYDLVGCRSTSAGRRPANRNHGPQARVISAVTVG